MTFLGKRLFFLLLLSAFCFNPTVSANFQLHRHRSHSLLIESKRSTELGRQRWKAGEGGRKGEMAGRVENGRR